MTWKRLRVFIGELGEAERDVALLGWQEGHGERRDMRFDLGTSLDMGDDSAPDTGLERTAEPHVADSLDDRDVTDAPQTVAYAPMPGAASPSLADESTADVGDAAGVLGGGFWARILSNVERTIDSIDRLTNFIDGYLDRPDVPEHHQAIFKSILGMFDSILVRLDSFVDLVDRYAPPRFDAWIDNIRGRIEEERKDIDAVLNPPESVEPPLEEAPAAPEQPGDGNDGGGNREESDNKQPEKEYTAADFTGDGKAVVVIDTGWNTEFLGSDERPVAEVDFYDTAGGGSASAMVSTRNDHGSWVDQVVRGVADGVDIIHLKVFPDLGGGAPMSKIEEALDWVIEQVRSDAFDIAAVNLSLGYGNTTVEQRTMLSDEFAELDDLNVFSVVAAGNSGEDGVQILASDANTIAVSASTSSNAVAGFSQHDAQLTDIFAFGQSVRVEKENGGADIVSGTSFAAPYVSGVAARLQQAANELIDQDLTDDQFLDILQQSGEDLSGHASVNDPAGYHVADANAALDYFLHNYQDYDTAA